MILLSISLTNPIFTIGIPVLGLIGLTIYSFKTRSSRTRPPDVPAELKKLSLSQILPLRLQAYERLTLFIERITPTNICIRLGTNSLTVADLHAVILNEIRNEYEHNCSQQLYVSEHAWQTLSKTKDETMLLINTLASALPPEGPAMELSTKILEQFSRLEHDSYKATIAIFRSEINNL